MPLCSWQRLVSISLVFARWVSPLAVLSIASLIASLGPAYSGQHGADTSRETTVAYYLEFHARGGSLVGHAFMLAGRILDSGRRVREHHFGFAARADGLEGGIGSLVGTPGTIRRQPLDLKAATLVQFNVRLNYQQYHHLERVLRRARTRAPTFRLLSVNCNYFAGFIARSVGLRASADTLVHPAAYVVALARLNSRPDQRLARGDGMRWPGVSSRHRLGNRAAPWRWSRHTTTATRHPVRGGALGL